MARLRLTIDSASERRRLPRTPTMALVTATISREEGVAVTTVSLVDTSACGIGVRSPIPAEPGDLFGFHFDGTVLPSRLGRVVRCEREEHGDWYRIGLAAEQKQAVA
jgi:PilZ domain-containing protein